MPILCLGYALIWGGTYLKEALKRAITVLENKYLIVVISFNSSSRERNLGKSLLSTRLVYYLIHALSPEQNAECFCTRQGMRTWPLQRNYQASHNFQNVVRELLLWHFPACDVLILIQKVLSVKPDRFFIWNVQNTQFFKQYRLISIAPLLPKILQGNEVNKSDFTFTAFASRC